MDIESTPVSARTGYPGAFQGAVVARVGAIVSDGVRQFGQERDVTLDLPENGPDLDPYPIRPLNVQGPRTGKSWNNGMQVKNIPGSMYGCGVDQQPVCMNII